MYFFTHLIAQNIKGVRKRPILRVRILVKIFFYPSKWLLLCQGTDIFVPSFSMVNTRSIIILDHTKWNNGVIVNNNTNTYYVIQFVTRLHCNY